MYWPKEDTATVVSKNEVTEPQTLAVKTACKVVVGRVPHTGVIAGTGKCIVLCFKSYNLHCLQLLVGSVQFKKYYLCILFHRLEH